LTPSDQGESNTFIDKRCYRWQRRKGAPGMPFVDRIGERSRMTLIIVGERSMAAPVAEEAQTGAKPRIWSPEPPAEREHPGSSAPLARALAAFEADVAGQEVRSIVLADDSDAALAAALVATKLLIPVVAVASAREPSSTNGRLIAQLAGSYTRPA
jgi:hypothetical protein